MCITTKDSFKDFLIVDHNNKDFHVADHNNKDFLIADTDNKESIVVDIQAKLRRSRSFFIMFLIKKIFQQAQISLGSRKGQQDVKQQSNIFFRRDLESMLFLVFCDDSVMCWHVQEPPIITKPLQNTMKSIHSRASPEKVFGPLF